MSGLENFLAFAIHRGGNVSSEGVALKHAVIAGWTGRDAAAVEHHIAELEKIGVPRPASVPIFYRVAATRITSAEMVEVAGEESSGEVEFVLVQHGGRLHVGVGSDHTDRKVETYNVTVSKQMCEKPIAPSLWAYDDVKPHWDRLILRSFACPGRERTLYQEGPVTAMRAPEELIDLYAGAKGLTEGTVMFCGTLAAQGGIRPAPRFEFELEDPVRGLRISHGYDIVPLPVMG